MNIEKDQVICGINAKTLRNAAKALPDYFGEVEFSGSLHLTGESAKATLTELIAEGWLMRTELNTTPKSLVYSGSVKWMQLRNAHQRKRISREKGKEIMEALLAHVKQYNQAADEHTALITEVFLFGSMLTGTLPDVGDVDVAIGYSSSTKHNDLRLLIASVKAVAKTSKKVSSYLSVHEVADLRQIGVDSQMIYSLENDVETLEKIGSIIESAHQKTEFVFPTFA